MCLLEGSALQAFALRIRTMRFSSDDPQRNDAETNELVGQLQQAELEYKTD